MKLLLNFGRGIALLSVVFMVSSCVNTIDPPVNMFSYVTFMHNTTDRPLLVTTTFVPIPDKIENLKEEVWGDSLVRIESGKIVQVMDYVFPYRISIYDATDTFLLYDLIYEKFVCDYSVPLGETNVVDYNYDLPALIPDAYVQSDLAVLNPNPYTEGRVYAIRNTRYDCENVDMTHYMYRRGNYGLGCFDSLRREKYVEAINNPLNACSPEVYYDGGFANIVLMDIKPEILR